jgi:HEAT repeat protein
VANTLVGLMTDPDIFVLNAVTKALLVWSGEENVPRLVALTTHKNIVTRGAAMDLLAELKDERGAVAVAQRFDKGLDRRRASRTLQAMGSVAQAAVVKRLNSNIKEVRIEACKILKEIGTTKCISALEEAARARDAEVAKAAAEALAKVKP